MARAEPVAALPPPTAAVKLKPAAPEPPEEVSFIDRILQNLAGDQAEAEEEAAKEERLQRYFRPDPDKP